MLQRAAAGERTDAGEIRNWRRPNREAIGALRPCQRFAMRRRCNRLCAVRAARSMYLKLSSTGVTSPLPTRQHVPLFVETAGFGAGCRCQSEAVPVENVAKPLEEASCCRGWER